MKSMQVYVLERINQLAADHQLHIVQKEVYGNRGNLYCMNEAGECHVAFSYDFQDRNVTICVIEKSDRQIGLAEYHNNVKMRNLYDVIRHEMSL